MAILREWRAEVRKTESSEYIDYIRTTGLADYRKTPGNMGAMIAVREIDEERTEVITLSLWSSCKNSPHEKLDSFITSFKTQAFLA